MNPLLFTDPLFLFFYAPIVLSLYFLTPARFRNVLLLLASVLFYAWGEGRYTLVLLASVALNYSFGRAIGSAKWVSRRHIWLCVGVTLNLVLLGVFKYLAFIAENIDLVLGQLHVDLLRVSPLHLPVGISFFTFMGISYLVDVHRKSIHLEADPIKFSLYLTLFPHLIAGPIVRYSAIAKELTSRRLSMEGIAYGTRRFVIGIGKKVLIANVAGAAADKVFLTPPGQLGAASAWLGAVCYTLQIYYDFSGYSDMAIGLAKMFGFTFPENFNYPYLSRSITEFWTRWHISLSSWLRDYLFFPLGVRRGRLRLYTNLLIVFFLCGLWHGAAWHFIVWGLFHGSLMVLERAGLGDLLLKLPSVLRRCYTLAAVMAGWVFFRADGVAQGAHYIGRMMGLSGKGVQDFNFPLLCTTDLLLAMAAGLLGCVPLMPTISARVDEFVAQVRNPAGAALLEGAVGVVRFAAIGLVFVAAAALSAASTYNPFIYFRF